MTYLRITLLVPVATAPVARMLNHFFAWAYLRQAQRGHPPGDASASISVVVPVRGLDPAAENFRSLYAQVSHRPYELIFAAGVAVRLARWGGRVGMAPGLHP